MDQRDLIGFEFLLNLLCVIREQVKELLGGLGQQARQ